MMVLSVAFFKQKEKIVIQDLYSTLMQDGLGFHIWVHQKDPAVIFNSLLPW